MKVSSDATTINKVCASGLKSIMLAAQTIQTGYKDVELWLADLGSFESVKSLKSKIAALERLDILVENAAVIPTEHSLAKDGYEQT